MKNNVSMKERLLNRTVDSDQPTITYKTPRAALFYISAIVTVISFFMNWLSLDLDLGLIQLNEVLGTVNPFTIPGGLREIKEVLSPYAIFLPEDLMGGITAARFAGWILAVVAVLAIVCYGYAIFLRIKEDDNCAKFGKLAAGLVVVDVIGFIILVVAILNAMDVSEAIGQITGKIITGPCFATIVGGVISYVCAVMDMGFKENIVIYHDGRIKIDNGPRWKCAKCGRKNLSRLERCYYCGEKK